MALDELNDASGGGGGGGGEYSEGMGGDGNSTRRDLFKETFAPFAVLQTRTVEASPDGTAVGASNKKEVVSRVPAPARTVSGRLDAAAGQLRSRAIARGGGTFLSPIKADLEEAPRQQGPVLRPSGEA